MKKIYLSITCSLLLAGAIAQQTQLASLRASERNQAVEINWTALTETGMQSHFIERSSNGSNFREIGRLPAQNVTTPFQYSFVDAAPVLGVNYYRLRSVSSTGQTTVSGIVRLNMGAIRTDINVMPNPVRNGVVNLQLNNLEKGKYAINIFNASGQQVYTYTMDHPGGNSTQIINLPANAGRGTHFLQLTNGATRFNKQLLLQ